MNTVIAPDEFTAANGFSVTKTGMVGTEPVDALLLPRPGRRPGLQGRPGRPRRHPGTGQVRFLRFHPWGLGVDTNASTPLLQPAGQRLRNGHP